LDDGADARPVRVRIAACYFFVAGAEAAVPVVEGAAAMVFGLSFFGFLVSRPPLAMMLFLRQA
jgi:hypothetical protein